MLVISALFFYASLTAFVYFSLLLTRLVSQSMGVGSKIKYPFYFIRALLFKDPARRIRQCAIGLWVSTLMLAIVSFILLAKQYGWIDLNF